MRAWWRKHNELLIHSGLKRSDLEDIVQNGPLKFRDGVLKFLDVLYAKKIPLVIISASGCGDAIEMMFEKVENASEKICDVRKNRIFCTDLLDFLENII